jgi:hypothetical protein
LKEQILEVAERHLGNNTRHFAARASASNASIHRALQEQQFYRYHVQAVEELAVRDAPVSRAFSQWNSQQSTVYRKGSDNQEKSRFSTTGITNLHNEPVWSARNPHLILSHHQQR